MTKIFLQNVNPFDFFLLLCFFVYGNIFTIQCSSLNWGFFLIFGIVIFLEIIDNLFYISFNFTKQKLNHFSTRFSKRNLSFSKNSPFFLLNTIKRGFLLGLFLEAFKVGS